MKIPQTRFGGFALFIEFFSSTLWYLSLNQTYSTFCKDSLEHDFVEIEKSGQMHISIEVKIGKFLLGNGTNQPLYAVRGTFSVPQRKYYLNHTGGDARIIAYVFKQ